MKIFVNDKREMNLDLSRLDSRDMNGQTLYSLNLKQAPKQVIRIPNAEIEHQSTFYDQIPAKNNKYRTSMNSGGLNRSKEDFKIPIN